MNSFAERDENTDAEAECHLVRMNPANYLAYTKNEHAMTEMGKAEMLPHLINIYNSCKAEKFSEKATEDFVSLVLNLTEEESKEHKFCKAVINP